MNNAHARETSFLDEPGLAALLGESFYARGIGYGATAILIAFDQDASYESPNFLWFRANRSAFVYIDRIIVAESARGRGAARLLYDDLAEVAKAAGYDRLVCEVNLVPPNPASVRFHTALGFSAVGEATLYGGAKTVRYFEKILT